MDMSKMRLGMDRAKIEVDVWMMFAWNPKALNDKINRTNNEKKKQFWMISVHGERFLCCKQKRHSSPLGEWHNDSTNLLLK